ncbi:flavodoxin reductase, partial [Fusobacterium animalis ATCC 51191]
MLSEKTLKRAKELQEYLNKRKEGYDVVQCGEDMICFVFDSVLLEKSYGIELIPVITLRKDIINITTRIDYDLDISKYSKILDVLHELNNDVIFKYYINTTANEVEAVYTIKDFDSYYFNNFDYIFNILSQILITFDYYDIVNKIIHL